MAYVERVPVWACAAKLIIRMQARSGFVLVAIRDLPEVREIYRRLPDKVVEVFEDHPASV
jgi:hypothetical protein